MQVHEKADIVSHVGALLFFFDSPSWPWKRTLSGEYEGTQSGSQSYAGTLSGGYEGPSSLGTYLLVPCQGDMQAPPRDTTRSYEASAHLGDAEVPGTTCLSPKSWLGVLTHRGRQIRDGFWARMITCLFICSPTLHSLSKQDLTTTAYWGVVRPALSFL